MSSFCCGFSSLSALVRRRLLGAYARAYAAFGNGTGSRVVNQTGGSGAKGSSCATLSIRKRAGQANNSPGKFRFPIRDSYRLSTMLSVRLVLCGTNPSALESMNGAAATHHRYPAGLSSRRPLYEGTGTSGEIPGTLMIKSESGQNFP